MAYNLDNEDANLTEEERKKKSAASNQTPGVVQGNQVGQTSSGSPLGDLITQVTQPTSKWTGVSGGTDADYQKYYDQGVAAGQDMSWMTGGTSQTKPVGGGQVEDGGYTGTGNVPTSQTPANPNMSGFEQSKLADANHQTVKYNVARILQQFPNTPEGLRQALPQIQKQYPSAKITGSKGDKLDFGDFSFNGEKIGSVDVLQGAGEGGRAWWWNPESQGGAGGGGAAQGGAGGGGAAQGGAGGGGEAQGGAPQYQTYNFGQGGQGMQTIGPNSIAQYKAGGVQQFNPADTSATQALVQQLLGKISSKAAPDTAGIKEGQKELLNQLRGDRNASIDQNAAARGVSGGNPAALHAGVEDAFAGDLTKSYRDIDQHAQEQEFTNLLQSLGAAQGVAGQQGAEGRANYASGLQGTQLQEALRQDEAQSGQSGFGLGLQSQGQNNQMSQFLQQLALQQRAQDIGVSQFDTSQSNAMKQFLASLDLQRRGQDIGVDQFGRSLDVQKDQFGRTLGLQQRAQDIGVDQFGKTLDRQKDIDWWNLILGNL